MRLGSNAVLDGPTDRCTRLYAAGGPPAPADVAASDVGAPPKADVRRPARVFVGVRAAPGVADELARLAATLKQATVRLVAPADIHLTLVPPWNETSIPDAVDRLRLATGRFSPFVLTFQHAGYGPEPKHPRLLWVECKATNDIAALRAALLQAFGQTDERPFRPHVTLARIRGNGAAVARRHPIDHEVLLTQRVASVELFQSPPPGERGYKTLASSPLGEAGQPAADG